MLNLPQTVAVCVIRMAMFATPRELPDELLPYSGKLSDRFYEVRQNVAEFYQEIKVRHALCLSVHVCASVRMLPVSIPVFICLVYPLPRFLASHSPLSAPRRFPLLSSRRAQSLFFSFLCPLRRPASLWVTVG